MFRTGSKNREKTHASEIVIRTVSVEKGSGNEHENVWLLCQFSQRGHGSAAKLLSKLFKLGSLSERKFHDS